MRARQLSFLKPQPRHFGGDHLKGRRKTARPLSAKHPLHVVMRASRAKGSWSMLHPQHEKHVRRLTDQFAKSEGVRIYRYANVGNHLHLLVKTPSRRAFQSFLRKLAGAIAMRVTGARKGVAQSFWDGRAFTRIVEWGRDLRNLEQYFVKNLFEAAGLLGRKAKAEGLRVIPIVGWG